MSLFHGGGGLHTSFDGVHYFLEACVDSLSLHCLSYDMLKDDPNPRVYINSYPERFDLRRTWYSTVQYSTAMAVVASRDGQREGPLSVRACRCVRACVRCLSTSWVSKAMVVTGNKGARASV